MEETLYIVTGADGHLGNTIVRQLLQEKKRVRGLVLPGSANGALDGLSVEVLSGDLRKPETLDVLFQTKTPCKINVIHTAGIVSIASGYRQEVYDVNVIGTKNLLAACKKYGVHRIIYTSSVHALPERPWGETIHEPEGERDLYEVHGLYAKTKALATELVLCSGKDGLNPVVVYPSGLIGPGDYGHGHLTQLVRDYLAGRLVACVRGGYDFTDVRDVAAGVLLALEKASAGEEYLLTGHYCQVKELLRQLHELTGKKEVRTVLPMWLAKMTAPLAEQYYRLRRQPPLYTAYSLYTLGTNALFSHEKAEKRLGYCSRPLRETLWDTVRWLRSHDGAVSMA